MRRILITVMMTFLLSVTVFGAEGSFETEPKSNVKEAYETYEISPVTKEVMKKRAVVFDVHSDGSYVVGCEDYDRKYVYVYTPDKDFWYGYSFSANGSFEVELFEDSLNVYLVRGACLIKLNPDGDVLAYETILDTQENNSYWNELQKNEQKIGNKTYSLKDRALLVLPFYSSLVVTDAEGNEEVLYEGKSLKTNSPTIIFFAIMIIFGATSTIVRIVKKKKNKTGENKSNENKSIEQKVEEGFAALLNKLEPEYKAEDLPPPPNIKRPKAPPIPQNSEESETEDGSVS